MCKLTSIAFAGIKYLLKYRHSSKNRSSEMNFSCEIDIEMMPNKYFSYYMIDLTDLADLLLLKSPNAWA